jgi:RimJ/RimL family protein N-acetyltransferase
MSRIVCHDHNRVGVWVMSRCDSEWFAGRGVTLALEDDNGNLIAGCVFEQYNGNNMFIHAACRPGTSLTEEYLHACFHFCFIENSCRRISCVVDQSNQACQRFVQRVGWAEECRLVGAGLNDGDLVIYKMTPNECKWLSEDEQNGIK